MGSQLRGFYWLVSAGTLTPLRWEGSISLSLLSTSAGQSWAQEMKQQAPRLLSEHTEALRSTFLVPSLRPLGSLAACSLQPCSLFLLAGREACFGKASPITEPNPQSLLSSTREGWGLRKPEWLTAVSDGIIGMIFLKARELPYSTISTPAIDLISLNRLN